MEFNYLYGKQAEQFAYVNIPKAFDSRGGIFGCLLGGKDAVWANHGTYGNVSEEQMAGRAGESIRALSGKGNHGGYEP